MSSRHSTQLINTLISAQKNVGSIPLHSGINSLLVFGELSASVYYRLAKQFRLTQYTANMTMHGYDAVFVDCRGTEICCPFENVVSRPAITVALIDENSTLPADTSIIPINHGQSKLELITEAELDSAVLKLRLDLCARQRSRPANADCSNTSFVKDNAYEILQTFVQNSTDWIVVKDLEHRFMIVSDRFLKNQNKTAQEVIGKNDLEIGTPAELVLGNKDKKWKGYWQLDKEAIASGQPCYSDHLVIHEHALEQVREQVAKIPLKNAAGNKSRNTLADATQKWPQLSKCVTQS